MRSTAGVVFTPKKPAVLEPLLTAFPQRSVTLGPTVTLWFGVCPLAGVWLAVVSVTTRPEIVAADTLSELLPPSVIAKFERREQSLYGACWMHSA